MQSPITLRSVRATMLLISDLAHPPDFVAVFSTIACVTISATGASGSPALISAAR